EKSLRANMENNVKILAEGCRVTDPNAGEVFAEGTRQYRTPIGRKYGSRYVSQSISLYNNGLSVSRRNATSEETLYVISGNGTCYIDEYAYAIRPGTAIYIPPGKHYQIDNPFAEPIEIVS